MSKAHYSGRQRAHPPKPVPIYATTLHVVIPRVKTNYSHEMKVIACEGRKEGARSPGLPEVGAEGTGPGLHRGNKMTHRRKASHQQARSNSQRHAASLGSCLGVRSVGPGRGWRWVCPGRAGQAGIGAAPGMGHPLVLLSSLMCLLRTLSEVKVHDGERGEQVTAHKGL